MTSIAAYAKEVEQALKAGNATEHTHRPALKSLIESLRPGITATNEPQRIACGSPDFIVTRKNIPLGYIEAKDIGVDLDRAEASDQLKRYRGSLRNLILTDYLEFRQYRNGDLVQTVRLGKPQKNGTLRRDADGPEKVENLLQAFLDTTAPTISSPRELAERMARLARLLHDLIRESFAHETTKGDLHSQHEAFKKVLIADLTVDQFADMYAQTIAYGLFAARCNHAGPGFGRDHAGRELPKTNPFLRKLFNTIAGADLDERIAWAVDDLAELLARADIESILDDFGKATRQEDPVVHFYETFLAAYDPALRESRGVYYTPEPVVGYIVRSINALLKQHFGLKTGLADRSTVTYTVSTLGAKKKSRDITTHRVQILDPACGTGTFLHAVVALIRESFRGAKGLWPSYVADHLLPRLYGFELLMAPYAVAHMKLGLQLQKSGYDFSANERLRVFLTNSLEEPHEFAGLPLFAQWLADEAAAASEVKRDVPIMVVLGNPPYSGISSNRGQWIEDLVGEYKREPDGSPLKEHKHWLNDDYVKFLRFAQWRIERTGYGVLGFVTNHGYLDNPTFRGMRHSLMQTFDHIYVLDLHGNSKKKEASPTGEKDKNVFDIQQGVAICLMVRTGTGMPGSVITSHADLWGTREAKYDWLEKNDATTTSWETIIPELPFLFFYPRSNAFADEYNAYASVKDIFRVIGLGFQSSRDHLVVGFTKRELIRKISDFLDAQKSDDEIRDQFFPDKKVKDYAAGDTRQWSLSKARAALRKDDTWRDAIRPTLYRPFDVRSVLYDARMVDWPRPEVLGHMLTENLCLLINRQSKEPFAALCSDLITERKIAAVYDASTTIPLYLSERGDLLDSDTLNLRQEVFESLADDLGLKTRKKGRGDLQETLGPEDVLAYIYAIFYSPTYRSRYETFHKTDFPRVPFTKSKQLFRKLVALGWQLIELHLMRSSGPTEPGYPIAGNNLVDAVEFENGRIYINAEQYFDGVKKEAWNYQIGGYQVAHKWLKDRKGRLLTFDDLHHYMRIIAALDETMRIQKAIDAAIPKWPLT